MYLQKKNKKKKRKEKIEKQGRKSENMMDIHINAD